METEYQIRVPASGNNPQIIRGVRHRLQAGMKTLVMDRDLAGEITYANSTSMLLLYTIPFADLGIGMVTGIDDQDNLIIEPFDDTWEALSAYAEDGMICSKSINYRNLRKGEPGEPDWVKLVVSSVLLICHQEKETEKGD